MTQLKYIGESFTRFIFEIKEEDGHLIGYGGIHKAPWDDVKKLLEDEEEETNP